MTFTIITEHDVLKGGEALYVFERRQVNGHSLGDGSHIVYVNGEIRGNQTELAKLMHDFFCTRPEDIYFEALARTVGLELFTLDLNKSLHFGEICSTDSRTGTEESGC